MEDLTEKIKKQKVNAYWERNQLVAALSKLFPAWLGKHDLNDRAWDADWRTIVYINIPPEARGVTDGKDFTHQISWHIHDSEVPMFDHLSYDARESWDGHDTEEKYRRLRKITPARLPLHSR